MPDRRLNGTCETERGTYQTERLDRIGKPEKNSRAASAHKKTLPNNRSEGLLIYPSN